LGEQRTFKTWEAMSMAEPRYAHVNGVQIAFEESGSGFPIVLLHGFPRTRRLWSKVTPALSPRFTVVAADRRGYGESERPGPEAPFDSGTIAQDHLELMRSLGHQRFLVVGHDRGAPVARRMAAEYPGSVVGALILDTAPQGAGYSPPRDSSGRTWYLDFFRQRDVAEQIIGQNPRLFFSLFINRHLHLTPEEHAFYADAFSRPGSTEAVLADYRAGTEIDGPYWEAEAAAGHKIHVPVYVIWGARGPAADAPMLDIWRRVADDVHGEVIANSAHYIPEEQPQATAGHVIRFADYLRLP
jgi:haloacetate dehalogenase